MSRASCMLAVLASAPTMTFSVSVSSVNGFSFWNVRPMPRRLILSGRSAVMGLPANVTLPASGVWKLVMRSNSVDLPAPLGPMMPRISPALTSNVMSELAVMPPNRLVRPLTSRITLMLRLLLQVAAAGAGARRTG